MNHSAVGCGQRPRAFLSAASGTEIPLGYAYPAILRRPALRTPILEVRAKESGTKTSKDTPSRWRLEGSHVRPRHADVLKESGDAGDLETFRATLAAVKAELYPDITDGILACGKETGVNYCATVRKRLNASRLGRVFILRGLIDLRKHG